MSVLNGRSCFAGLLICGVCLMLSAGIFVSVPQNSHLSETPSAEIDTATADSLAALLNEYVKETNALVEANADQGEREAFYREWLQRLRAALEQAGPDDPYRRGALAVIVSLANGIGDTALAEQLTERLIAETADPAWKVHWRRVQGAFALQEDARRAEQALSQAVQTAQRPENLKQLRNSETMAFDYATAGRMLAEVQFEQLNRPVIAAETLNRIQRNVAQMNTSIRDSLSQRFVGEEFFAGKEAEYLAMAGRIQASLDVVESMSLLQTTRLEASTYAERIASLTDPGRGVQYREIIENWLSRGIADSWTPALRLRLALSYQSDSAHNTARSIAEDLFANHLDELKALDQAAAIDSDRQGHEAMLLTALGTAAISQGDFAAARAYLDLLRQTAPLSPGRDRLEQSLIRR